MNAMRWIAVPVIISFAALFALPAARGASKKTPPPPRYTISGHIAGLASSHHARVAATANNKPTRTATTQAEGSYTLRNVAPGSYSIRPTRSGYTFSPSFRTVAVTTADRVDIDFVAHPLPKKGR